MHEEDTTNSDLIPAKTSATARRHPCLVVISGKMVGRKFPLNQASYIIGRGAEVAIPLPEQMVSRRHAELMIRSNQVLIKDLKSKNGVYVNDLKVVGSSLKDGDIIRIGTTVFKFITGGKNESLYYNNE